MSYQELKYKSNQIAFSNYKSLINGGEWSTSTNFTTPVLEFLNWIENRGIIHISTMTQQDFNDYYGYLTTRPNQRKDGTLSMKTISSHFGAINKFLEMLLDDGAINRTYLFPSFSLSESKERNVLTIDEIHQLLNHCKNPLERNIINTAYGCGLRREEMELLNASDIQLNRGVLIVRNGKGEKRREIPLTDRLVNEFRDYLTIYRPMLLKETKLRQTAFFVNAKGERMTGDNLNDTLKYIINRTGNNEIIEKNITLHCLRHSIATHFIDAGANLEFVQGFLGHCEIDTTLLYMVRRKKRLLIA